MAGVPARGLEAGRDLDASTLRHPEPGFFTLGAKSYGRNPAFLLRSGFRQVEELFTLLFDGGSDEAGFVQVIQGKVDDPERLRRLIASDPLELRRMRPEIIGATLALEPDGSFTETVAFTDEASARSGEGTPPPEEVRAELEYTLAGATFYDLRAPWFGSP